MGNILLSSITFLAAFLLFAIELIIAKIFLPAYGGSYLVWGASIVFFQAVLLFGYWFSHHLIARLGLARYRYLHLTLLMLPLVVFPGRALKPVNADASIALVLDVFLQLAFTIGPVFFVLSTISIVTQMWLSRSRLSARINPYALYAVSNFGSFAALLSYPFVIELFLGIPQQLMIWRVLYFALIVLNALAYFLVPVETSAIEARVSKSVDRSSAVRWAVLGAAGSMAFLSVNNLITYELPPVPLFWILPLGIYLLSFVLNFKKTPWCPQWMVRFIAPVIGVAALFYFFIQKYDMPPLVEFFGLLGILFILCMYCQDQLIKLKPQDDENLTAFYFWISLGSFLGGVVTTWVIPLLSNSMIEYLWALLVVSSTLIYADYETRFSARMLRVAIYVCLLYFVWSAYFVHFNTLAVFALFVLTWASCFYLSKIRFGVVTVIGLLLLTSPVQEKMWDRKATDSSWKIRNYYGIHQVVDSQDVRWLYHGRTLHGAQFLSPGDRQKPITYYGPHSGVWEVMANSDLKFTNIALIGLGTGTMSVFTHAGQSLDIFELDPDVYRIAQEKFYFLNDSQASRRVFIGDARRSLKDVRDRVYDLMLIDAFGGDTIPVHLLTKEVFEEYRARMTDNGVIVVHVSNRYVDLVPVLARVAGAVGANICYKESVNQGPHYTGSYWMFISWDKGVFDKIASRPTWITVTAKDHPGRVWTDNYSSILPAMRKGYLIDTVRNFRVF